MDSLKNIKWLLEFSSEVVLNTTFGQPVKKASIDEARAKAKALAEAGVCCFDLNVSDQEFLAQIQEFAKEGSR